VNLNRKLVEVAHRENLTRPDEEGPMSVVDDRLDTAVSDDLLRLIFIACHPVLSSDSQVALTLRTVAGLRTPEIARAFLVSEATVGQRISRAKKTLADRNVRFELPAAHELPERLGAVLAVIYLIFNEGYSATAGSDWMRPALCNDALRLSRLVTRLQPDQAEAHGLLALLELQASRIPARSDPAGDPVLLDDQDRRSWDQLLIRRGLGALRVAEDLGGGPYTVQAAIAACHARARSVESTDWRRVSALYTVLYYLQPSPVVLLNRAVAVAMAEGAERGLEVVAPLRDEPSLAAYPQLAAVRATLLQRLGRFPEAAQQFRRAAAETSNDSQRRLFLRQAESGIHTSRDDTP
jgi:predicted RNA polymerase sigma factor